MTRRAEELIESLRVLLEPWGRRWLDWPIEPEKIPEDEVRRLAELYSQMSVAPDEISDWVNEQSGPPPPRSLCPAVRNVLVLFEVLGDAGVEPFADGLVRNWGPKNQYVYDWTTLPDGLTYLVDACQEFVPPEESFGDIHRMLDRLDEEMWMRLERCAAMVNRDRKAIDEWIDRYPMDLHPTTSRVYLLLGMMDDAEMLD